jgi:hypothetical protein
VTTKSGEGERGGLLKYRFEDQQTFSIEGQRVKIVDFVGYIDSGTT